MDAQSAQKRIFLIDHENSVVDGKIICGDVGATLDYIRSYLLEMDNNDEQTFEITRCDMTNAELESAPVL